MQGPVFSRSPRDRGTHYESDEACPAPTAVVFQRRWMGDRGMGNARRNGSSLRLGIGIFAGMVTLLVPDVIALVASVIAFEHSNFVW